TVDNLKLADLLHLTRALQGVSTGAADFRAVPGHTTTLPSTGQSVVIADPPAKLLFKRLREGRPLGGIGKELALTPPSPANIKIRVYDAASGGKAARVNDYLQESGFDTYAMDGSNPLKR